MKLKKLKKKQLYKKYLHPEINTVNIQLPVNKLIGLNQVDQLINYY